MSKKKPQHRKKPGQGGSLERTMGRAEQLLLKEEWDDAAAILFELTGRYPNNYDVWAMLSDALQHLGDNAALWEAVVALLRIAPQDADNWFNAVHVAMMNMMPFTALHYAREFLQRFPDSYWAKEITINKASIEQAIDEIHKSPSTDPGATDLDFMELEQATTAINNSDFPLAERLSRQVIARSPHLAAPSNNLSLIYALQGNLDKAIDTTRKILEQHPDNLHALSNLVQYLVRKGQISEAKQFAEQLVHSPQEEERLLKQIEALSYLGDDAKVIALFERASAPGKKNDLTSDPMLSHLVAVAYARQGNEKRAKQLWQQALKVSPGFDLAQRNLENLRNPVGERSAAFAFTLQYWIPVTWAEGLLQAAERGRSSDKALKSAMDKFLEATPELVALLPILFERGDDESRVFALQIARTAQLPLLRDFALGEQGTDSDRLSAAQQASELGMLPRGQTVSLYIKGERQDVMLFDYEITTEPDTKGIPKVTQKVIEKIHATVSEKQYVKAEQLAREALATAPNVPTLWNFLAVSLQAQEKQGEYASVTRQMAEKFPDYFFAKVGMARLLIDEGNTAEAKKWLEPLMRQKRFHLSEFNAFCIAHIELDLADKQYDGAKTWLQFWQQTDPDNPTLKHYQRRLLFR